MELEQGPEVPINSVPPRVPLLLTIYTEVQKSQERSEDTGVLDRNLNTVKAQLASREKQKARVWKAFELTGDEETFKKSIGQLQREVESLQQERLRLGGQ